MHNIIPQPTSICFTAGNFTISPQTKIYIQKENSEITSIGSLLAESLTQATGYEHILEERNPNENEGDIQLTLNGDPTLGEEGYELCVTSGSILLSANCPAGL